MVNSLTVVLALSFGDMVLGWREKLTAGCWARTQDLHWLGMSLLTKCTLVSLLEWTSQRQIPVLEPVSHIGLRMYPMEILCDLKLLMLLECIKNTKDMQVLHPRLFLMVSKTVHPRRYLIVMAAFWILQCACILSLSPKLFCCYLLLYNSHASWSKMWFMIYNSEHQRLTDLYRSP